MADQHPHTEERWPLDGICLNTIIKVHDFDAYHHAGDNPYYQISVGGFIMVDCMGDILFTEIQMSAEDGDTDEVSRLQELFTPGSLHYVKSEHFFYGDRSIDIQNPETKLVAHSDYEAINSFFPVKVASGRDPAPGEFYYAGDIFVEGRGNFRGFMRKG